LDLPDLPDTWRLLSLIDITEQSPLWSARVRCSNGDYTHGEGSSPRYAILDAIRRIDSLDIYSPLADPADASGPSAESLANLLNIQPKPFPRRI
jgi:hypothetical protein